MQEFTRHKQRLMVIAEGVNAFSSEPVQVKVISWLLDHPEILFKESEAVKEIPDTIMAEPSEPPIAKTESLKADSKQSIPITLKELLSKGFFNEPKTIVEITNFCNDRYESVFFPNNVSAALMKLIDSGSLFRQHSEQLKRYTYQKLV